MSPTAASQLPLTGNRRVERGSCEVSGSLPCRGEKGRVVVRKGRYNPWNKWKTTHGVIHLCQPANTLIAEIALGADATVLRKRGGRPVDDPHALICCSWYGGPMRNSDPTIGSSVNNLARLGCWITLKNPVGLYINHLDLSGITRPDGPKRCPITAEYFRIERGSPAENMIERAVFEVPPSEQLMRGQPITGVVGRCRLTSANADAEARAGGGEITAVARVARPPVAGGLGGETPLEGGMLVRRG
jgi:hypothetical protein